MLAACCRDDLMGDRQERFQMVSHQHFLDTDINRFFLDISFVSVELEKQVNSPESGAFKLKNGVFLELFEIFSFGRNWQRRQRDLAENHLVQADPVVGPLEVEKARQRHMRHKVEDFETAVDKVARLSTRVFKSPLHQLL